jgi:serine/threonine protein kinase
MADPWIPAHWLRAGIPWGRSFKLIGGAYVNKDLRLVRPALDAGMRDTWVADHFGRQAQVAVTFASGHFDAEGQPMSVPAEVRAAQAERFAHRALLGVTLADPRLVQIFETGDAKGVPFIVTELLEGKSLRHRLVQGDGALSLAEARAVLSQVAAVLAKCHEKQIAHGDIRSDHLFSISGAAATLTSEPFVKIGNLAAGTNVASRGEETSSLLEHAYLSPERLLRPGLGDAASDVWALAVTLYELLTTTLPFEATTSAGVAVAICNAQFSPPSHYRADLPATVDAWFARAFAREPHDRFQTVLELAQSFGQALDGAESGSSASADVGAWSEPALDDDDDDGEEEEKTVKWDLPADWSLPGSSPSAAAFPVLPRPPLPVPGSELAAMRLAAASSPSTVPPPSRPGAFFTGDLARVARLPPAPHAFTLPALRAVPAAYPAAAPVPRRRLGMLGQGLLFGAALGAVSALSLWIVQSVSSPGEDSTASTELALEPRYDNDGNVIAQKPPPRRVPDPKELPRIIQTDDLPTVPDDAEDDLEEPSAQTITVSSVKSEAAPARPASSSATLSQPTSEKPGLSFSNRPASPPAPAARRPARPAAPKQAKAASSCNPPYFFDSNNIRRLKLECL